MTCMTEDRLPALQLQPSRRLAGLLIIAHAAAGGMLWLLPLPVWAQTGLCVILFASAAHGVSRHALHRGNRAITVLQFRDRERLDVRRGDGSWQTGRILGSSIVGTLLTVLNIRLAEQRLPAHVVLLGDSLGSDDFRQLRVWLRWGPRGADDPAE